MTVDVDQAVIDVIAEQGVLESTPVSICAALRAAGLLCTADGATRLEPPGGVVTVLHDLLAAVGATEPTPAEPSRFAGWPILGIAGVIGLIGTAWLYRHRPGDDE